MPAEPRVYSAAEVLAEAILAAQVEKAPGELHEVMFWRYAAVDAGWGWSLKFVTEAGMSGVTRGDSDRQRVLRIVDKWSKAYELQRAQELADQAARAAEEVEES